MKQNDLLTAFNKWWPPLPNRLSHDVHMSTDSILSKRKINASLTECMQILLLFLLLLLFPFGKWGVFFSFLFYFLLISKPLFHESHFALPFWFCNDWWVIHRSVSHPWSHHLLSPLPTSWLIFCLLLTVNFLIRDRIGFKEASVWQADKMI